ncbi:alpha/beta fold hydrolase [Halovulum sp. GXIMD14793]
MTVLFLHGVPDTPHMWQPLIKATGLTADQVRCPALPGFGQRPPKGFTGTKDALADWAIAQLEAEAAQTGPVDLVGHDWGALISLHIANTRSDLVRSLAVFNGCMVPNFRWHKHARKMQTPIWGEISMAMATKSRIEQALLRWGMPADMARHEAAHCNRHMKRALLRLYRSALDVGTEWGTDLSGLPAKTHVFWGDLDPFGKASYAAKFCEKWGLRLQVEADIGHWTICQQPEAFVDPLQALWS